MGHLASIPIPARIEAILDNPNSLRSFKHKARETLNETGHLPQTKLWDYLRDRRDQNPKRFDHYHPELKWLFHHEHGLTVPATPITTTGAPTPTPAPVDEPRTVNMLGIALLAALVYWAWRTKS